MKKTAVAPSNIAFIKYWGKADDVLRLPLNSSISMNLSGAYTTTTVEFDPSLTSDNISLLDGNFSEHEIVRVVKALDRIREKAGVSRFARVVTKNTFPKGAGAAASASGFAALTLAAFASLEKKLIERELTVFARMGSGSACRSIPDGFVEWKEGKTSDESYAYSLHSDDYWALSDVLVIVDTTMKKVSTSEGMESVQTSPLLSARLNALPGRIDLCKRALADKNFMLLGEVIEEDCLDMHSIMQSQIPPLVYWNDDTKRIMEAVVGWRKDGLQVYFTIDAGPNVHLICESKDEREVIKVLRQSSGFTIREIIVNRPAKGAHIITDHLF